MMVLAMVMVMVVIMGGGGAGGSWLDGKADEDPAVDALWVMIC